MGEISIPDRSNVEQEPVGPAVAVKSDQPVVFSGSEEERLSQLAAHLGKGGHIVGRYTDKQRVDFLESCGEVFELGHINASGVGSDVDPDDLSSSVHSPATVIRKTIDDSIDAKHKRLGTSTTVLQSPDPYMATRTGPICTDVDLTASFQVPTW